MTTPGARIRSAMFAAAGLLCVDARLAFAQQPPAAQEGLQEVVVTAERRQENLQTVPIAISAISTDTMIKQGVTDYEGVAETSTAINFTPYPSSSNTLILYMRGQGVADANQITQDGSVGLYEDGFYISRPQAQTFDLADPERVEILRGPQGTLYGRNTTGGAVNIISKKPSGDLDFKFSLDGGSRSFIRALGVMDLPTIAGGLTSKFSVFYSSIDGNVTNAGGSDYNKEEQRGARAYLRWDTGGIFTADYFFEWGEIDSTPIYYQDPQLAAVVPGYTPATNELASQTWEPLSLPPSDAKYNSDGLILAWKLGSSTTLRLLGYYRGLDTRFTQNYASAFSNPALVPFQGLTTFNGNDVILDNEKTGEAQLIGDLGKNVNYVLGLYYFDDPASHGENGVINIPTPAPGPPFYQPFSELSYRYVTADAISKAAYGQLNWGFAPNWSLALGARYTVDNRDASRTYTIDETISVFIPGVGIIPVPINNTYNASNSLKFDKFNYNVALSWAITPDVNTYARVATGYKAGGSSEAAPTPTAQNPVDGFTQTFAPENDTSYELGLKTYSFEHRLRTNIALFYTNITDMQLQFNVNPANLAIVQSYNAGQAHYSGAELELQFAPVTDFMFGLNYSYLDGQLTTVTAEAGTIFDPAVNPGSPYKVGQNINFLFQAPYAPKNIATAYFDWTLWHTGVGSLEAAFNYRYQDRQFDTVSTGAGVPNAAQYYSIPAYGVLGGRFIWNFNMSGKQTMKFAVWGTNITNKVYPLHVIGQGSAPLVPLYNGLAPPFGPVTPQTGYTYQAVAWAPKAIFGAQIIYGF